MNYPAPVRSLCAVIVALIAIIHPSATDAQQLTFAPEHATGIYAVGERVGWTVSVPPGSTASTGAYTYTVKRNGLEVVKTGSITLAGGPAKIETSLDAPAMLVVEVRPPAGTMGFGGRSTGGDGRVLLGAAVAPTAIQPTEPRPADFDAFWSAKIAQLMAIPAAPVLTPGASGKPGVDYATIKMNNINGAHVYGQLAKPSREGKFPALLILQWASPPYPLQKQWVTDHATEGWLTLNIEPHDVPSDMPQAFYDALPQIIKSYNTIGQLSRDESYFLAMYLGDYRAIEYLASRPDWDGKTIVVMGTSMGGQQSLAVAGLNPRVTALIVDVPAGADVTASLHGRAAGYPNWNVSRPEVLETARYFDVVNFASRITAKSLVAMGFIDDVSPPAGIWTAFNLIKGPKEAAPMFDSPHNHLATAAQQLPYTKRSEEWLSVLVRGGDPTAGTIK
jgi:cephalosporin-C deacetylase-like acetyl esterase